MGNCNILIYLITSLVHITPLKNIREVAFYTAIIHFFIFQFFFDPAQYISISEFFSPHPTILRGCMPCSHKVKLHLYKDFLSMNSINSQNILPQKGQGKQFCVWNFVQYTYFQPNCVFITLFRLSRGLFIKNV